MLRLSCKKKKRSEKKKEKQAYNMNITVVLLSVTSITSFSLQNYDNKLLNNIYISQWDVKVDGEQGLKSFMQQLKRWPWCVQREGQGAERVHSDTYIPVQPNL